MVNFARNWGDAYGWCKSCYSAMRRRYWAELAGRFAEQARELGQDPADSRGYRWYSQDPDEVLRAAKRRRAEVGMLGSRSAAVTAISSSRLLS